MGINEFSGGKQNLHKTRNKPIPVNGIQKNGNGDIKKRKRKSEPQEKRGIISAYQFYLHSNLNYETKFINFVHDGFALLMNCSTPDFIKSNFKTQFLIYS